MMILRKKRVILSFVWWKYCEKWAWQIGKVQQPPPPQSTANIKEVLLTHTSDSKNKNKTILKITHTKKNRFYKQHLTLKAIPKLIYPIFRHDTEDHALEKKNKTEARCVRYNTKGMACRGVCLRPKN